MTENEDVRLDGGVSQDDEDTGGMDPGLMVLMFLGSSIAMLWLGPVYWDVLVTGDLSGFSSISEGWWESLGDAFRRLGSGFADPDDHGVAAYTFNWLYTLWLFLALMSLIVVPSFLRSQINQLFEEADSDA